MDDIANYVIYLAVYLCHPTVYQLHIFQIQGDYLDISNTQKIFTLSTNAKVLTTATSNIQTLISGYQEYNYRNNDIQK